MLDLNLKETLLEEPFLATYILYEMAKPIESRQYGEYLDTLPFGCKDFPLLFTEKEMDYLEGTTFKDQV